jgi:hypothetical protein
VTTPGVRLTPPRATQTATIRLEAIGDDLRVAVPHFRKHRDQRPPPRVAKNLYRPLRHPWVAEVGAPVVDGRPTRTPVHGQRDTTGVRGLGARGVYMIYTLRAGKLYEVNDLISHGRERRYFCRVADGRIEEITEAEVTACLG